MDPDELVEWWQTATPEQRLETLRKNPWMRGNPAFSPQTANTATNAVVVRRLPQGADILEVPCPDTAPLPRKPRQREEDELISDIIEAAHIRGWLCYHQRPARTGRGYRTALQGDAGFPDLVLVHPLGWVIFAEVKSQKSQLSPQQEVWCRALAIIAQDAYQSVDYYVWRPADWPELCRILEGK